MILDWLKENSGVVSGLIAAAVSIVFGLLTWWTNTRVQSAAQKWKRREFVVGWLEKLRSDALAQIAMQALDQSGPRLPMALPHEWKGGDLPKHLPVAGSPHLVRVGSGMTFRALVPHTIATAAKLKVDLEDMELKRCFDALFGRLDELHAMTKAGLISKAELEPYIGYWMRLLTGTRATTKGQLIEARSEFKRIFVAVRLYLNHYGYTGVIALGESFGHHLKEQPEDEAFVKEEAMKIGQPSK